MVATIILAPFALPLIVLYFSEIDRRMVDPHDGYWQLGALVTGRNRNPNWADLGDFAMGSVIKGLFLPVMFSYLAANMPGLSAQFATVGTGPVQAVAYLAKVMIVMELTIVVVGYTITMRLFDAHIRSTNPFPLAWIVTLVCYEPLNQIVTSRVLNNRPGRSWTEIIDGYPMLMWPWLGMILLSFFVWVWATAIFGLRWSNLTNCGTITNGPYKYTKHPDYVAKSVFFWLTAAPFLTAFTAWEAFTASAGLVAVNMIYFGRGRMEEKHMSQDPAYVAYALEMNRRSIFRFAARCLPFLMYTPPGDHHTCAIDLVANRSVPAE